MMTWIREKFGTVLITIVIAFIALVMVVSGIFNRSRMRGVHEGAVAGEVNGEPITMAEFNREYTRRVEFYRQMMPGVKDIEPQLKAFRVREQVFQELASSKLMVQEAARQGLAPSKEELRAKVQAFPAFQRAGRFDMEQYKAVLAANGLTPGAFEHMMGSDLSQQAWSRYFRDRISVSDEEVKRQFLLAEDQRDVKYVLLTTEAGRRDVKVSDEDVKKFLATPEKLNLAKSQFEQRKAEAQPLYKDAKFDDVMQAMLARENLAAEKSAEVRKANDALADRVVPLLKAGKGSDAALNALLKPYGVEVKQTGKVARSGRVLPGIGEAPELMADAFAAASPIDAAAGKGPKKYGSAAWVLVALVTDRRSPDLSKFEGRKAELARQVVEGRERELMQAFMKKLTEKSKIEGNPEVIAGGAVAAETG